MANCSGFQFLFMKIFFEFIYIKMSNFLWCFVSKDFFQIALKPSYIICPSLQVSATGKIFIKDLLECPPISHGLFLYLLHCPFLDIRFRFSSQPFSSETISFCCRPSLAFSSGSLFNEFSVFLVANEKCLVTTVKFNKKNSTVLGTISALLWHFFYY